MTVIVTTVIVMTVIVMTVIVMTTKYPEYPGGCYVILNHAHAS